MEKKTKKKERENIQRMEKKQTCGESHNTLLHAF